MSHWVWLIIGIALGWLVLPGVFSMFGGKAKAVGG